MIKTATRTIPNKIATIWPHDIPWTTVVFANSLKSHKLSKHSNTNDAWNKFKHSRNEVTAEIRKSKSQYNSNLEEKLNSSNVSSKEWFKTAKQITNIHKINHIPTLNDNTTGASTDEEKANLLNIFFCSQSTIDDSNSQLPDINALTNSTLEGLTITEQDVKDAVSCIDPSKASGPGLVSPRLIPEGVAVLAAPLSSFTKLIATSSFPLPWKRGKCLSYF